MPPEIIIVLFIYALLISSVSLLTFSDTKDVLPEWKGVPKYLIYVEQILSIILACFYMAPVFGYGQYSMFALIPYIALLGLTVYLSFIKRKSSTFTFFVKRVTLMGNKSYLYGILSIVGQSILVYLTIKGIYP